MVEPDEHLEVAAMVDGHSKGYSPIVVRSASVVPVEIAVQHARMVVCAMRSGEESKAFAAVRRAFALAAEQNGSRITQRGRP